MTRTPFETELQTLKDWDMVQFTEQVAGYSFIATAGHGYLVVTKADPNYKLAEKICSYGFKGELAVYLEEDCEANDFLKKVIA